MCVYFASTNLLGAVPVASGEPGGIAFCVAFCVAAAFYVALRVLVRRVDRRAQKRSATERIGVRSKVRSRCERSRGADLGERRRAALSSLIVVLGIAALPLGPKSERNVVERTDAEATLAQNAADVRFESTDVSIKNGADAEEARLVDAAFVQETEARDFERVGEKTPSGDRARKPSTFVADLNAPRLVKTAGDSGELIAVEPIRAESSLSIPPAPSVLPSATPAPSEYATDWNAATTLPTRGPSVAELAAETSSADAWKARPNEAAEAARRASVQAVPQTSSSAEARASRGGVVPAYREEAVDVRKGGTEIAAAFAPDEPLIPYASEPTDGVASVSYEERDSRLLLEQLDAERRRAGARVKTAVLMIEAQKHSARATQDDSKTGCGFLFQYRGGVYLATNRHNVEESALNQEVKIVLPNGNKICPKRIIKCDDFDLAALELDVASLPKDGSATLCRFGDSDALRVSDSIYTVGNPLALDYTVTHGYISAIRRRKSDVDKSERMPLEEFIQLDANINPGNSGGPAYNSAGEVVGVVTAIKTATGKSQGVAFAIPINAALRVLKSMIDSGGWNRAYMGVELEKNSANGGERTARNGSKILKVNANSPAEKAGLRGGDVVLEYDGEAVEDDLHLARLIALTNVGEEPVVKVRRDGQTFETTPRLERSGSVLR